jgi:cyclopropane fatty-acyl-phospholipid synthase-like methyltransferase
MAHVCPWWFAYTFDNPLRRFFHKPEKILAPYVRPGMTVMDVGCGMGFFSIAMARLVGDEGKVVSVDLQPQMLAAVERRAARAGLLHRIRTRRCSPDAIGMEAEVDFALAFWMAHEVPAPGALFSQIRNCLAPQGRFLVAEPRMHVSAEHFRRAMDQASGIGFVLLDEPRIRLSRSALFSRN